MSSPVGVLHLPSVTLPTIYLRVTSSALKSGRGRTILGTYKATRVGVRSMVVKPVGPGACSRPIPIVGRRRASSGTTDKNQKEMNQ